MRGSLSVAIAVCASVGLALGAAGCIGGEDELSIDVSGLVQVQGVNPEAPFSAGQLQAAMVENLQGAAPDNVTFETGGGGGTTTSGGTAKRCPPGTRPVEGKSG